MLSFEMVSGKEMVYVYFIVGATFYLSSELPIELITLLKFFISWHNISFTLTSTVTTGVMVTLCEYPFTTWQECIM